MKNFLCCLTLAAVAFVAPAQEAKKAAAPKKAAGSSAVLHPEMKVAENAGTFEKPMGTLGEKGEVWTATTVSAGVDGKPQPGKPVTVVGEIIDMSCYLQLGKHGEKHAACGKKCIAAGQPVGLLTKNGSVYMLMEEEHDPRRDGQTSAFRRAAIEHLAHIMEVTGTEASHGGYKAIYVQGYVSK